MTTPPRPDRAEYEAALRRIHGRRRRAGDDHPLALSEDPRDVLSYLRQRGRAGLIADDTGDDITDALTLKLWIWWEIEAAEVWLLEAAEALGRNRLTVGAVLGLTSGQSLVNRMNRKRATLSPGRVASSAPAASDTDDPVRALAAELVDRRAEMPADIAEDLYVEEVADALPRWARGAPPPTEGVLAALRFLLGDLAAQLAPDASLRGLVERGTQLVAPIRSTAFAICEPGPGNTPSRG